MGRNICSLRLLETNQGLEWVPRTGGPLNYFPKRQDPHVSSRNLPVWNVFYK